MATWLTLRTTHSWIVGASSEGALGQSSSFAEHGPRPVQGRYIFSPDISYSVALGAETAHYEQEAGLLGRRDPRAVNASSYDYTRDVVPLSLAPNYRYRDPAASSPSGDAGNALLEAARPRVRLHLDALDVFADGHALAGDGGPSGRGLGPGDYVPRWSDASGNGHHFDRGVSPPRFAEHATDYFAAVEASASALSR